MANEADLLHILPEDDRHRSPVPPDAVLTFIKSDGVADVRSFNAWLAGSSPRRFARQRNLVTAHDHPEHRVCAHRRDGGADANEAAGDDGHPKRAVQSTLMGFDLQMPPPLQPLSRETASSPD